MEWHDAVSEWPCCLISWVRCDSCGYRRARGTGPRRAFVGELPSDQGFRLQYPTRRCELA